MTTSTDSGSLAPDLIPALRFAPQPAVLAGCSRRFARTTIFRPRPDHELYEMPDDELVRYLADAKRTKQREHAVTAMHMLLFKHEDHMRYLVGVQVPRHLRHHVDVVADWVIERVSKSLLKLPLRGESAGEFVNYYKAAIHGRVIDFFRTTEGKTLEREQRLPSEHDGDDGVVDTLGEEADIDALVAQLDFEAVAAAALARMQNAEHVAIVRRGFWDDQPSKVVAAELGTTPANVDQVKTRFRRLVREECEARGVMNP